MNVSRLNMIGVQEIEVPVPVDSVYVLVDEDGEVVYIGKTNNPMRRIGGHIDDQIKSFAFAYVVDIDDFTAIQVEAALIGYFQPKYNQTLTKRGKRFPFGSIDQMIIDLFVIEKPIETMYRKAVNLL